MKPKYGEKIYRDLAKDLRLMKYEDRSRDALIQKLGGHCEMCQCDDASVLEVQTPKGLKACNFKDRLRWVSLPGFFLICGNCRVRNRVEERKKKIADITDVLCKQWLKEQSCKVAEQERKEEIEEAKEMEEAARLARQNEASKRIMDEQAKRIEDENAQRRAEDKWRYLATLRNNELRPIQANKVTAANAVI